jgi:hypothetical protein
MKLLLALALAAFGRVAHAGDHQALRRLLQRGRYHEAKVLASALLTGLPAAATPGERSDAALAAFLASDGGDAATMAAVNLFLSIAADQSLPNEVRLAACRNAAHVEGEPSPLSPTSLPLAKPPDPPPYPLLCSPPYPPCFSHLPRLASHLPLLYLFSPLASHSSLLSPRDAGREPLWVDKLRRGVRPGPVCARALPGAPCGGRRGEKGTARRRHQVGRGERH